MNKYQERKYEREASKLSSQKVNQRISQINRQIVDCLENNKRKRLKQAKQMKSVLERYQ